MQEAKSKQSNGTTATTTGRTITVVSTRGEKKKLSYEGGEWAGLRDVLKKEGYDLQNMKCVEGVRKSTLEHDKAVLPDGDFHLFLMPYKSKLGGLSRAEINAAIKEHIKADGDKAKEYFGQFGNYTQVASSKLEGLLEGYQPGSKKTIGKEKAKAVAEVVQSVKAAKGSVDVYDEVRRLSTDDKLFLIIDLLTDIKDSLAGGGAVAKEAVAETIGKTQEEIDNENKQKEIDDEKKRQDEEKEKKAEEKRQKREQKKAELQKKLDEEDSTLNNEMNDLLGGFSDVDKRSVSKVKSRVSDDDVADDEED